MPEYPFVRVLATIMLSVKNVVASSTAEAVENALGMVRWGRVDSIVGWDDNTVDDTVRVSVDNEHPATITFLNDDDVIEAMVDDYSNDSFDYQGTIMCFDKRKERFVPKTPKVAFRNALYGWLATLRLLESAKRSTYAPSVVFEAKVAELKRVINELEGIVCEDV